MPNVDNKERLLEKKAQSGVKALLFYVPFFILHLDPYRMELRKAFTFSLRVCHSFHLINTDDRTSAEHPSCSAEGGGVVNK